MKLAISNIAWPADQDDKVAEALAECGVTGVEIAPTKVWPDPLRATDMAIDAYRRSWEARGIAVVAAQSLLFGRPDLTLFEDAAIRKRTLDYLRQVIRLCGRLGAKSLVFGSPKNRRVADRDRRVAWQEAVDFFGRLGDTAADEGTVVVMEANPPEYGTDFITRAAEAVELVRTVNHPGFLLHLDTACMTLAGDSASIIGKAVNLLRHFHVSEPGLGLVGTGTVDHTKFAQQLQAHHYAQWVSIEMRERQPFVLDALVDAIRYVAKVYQIVS